MHNLEFLEDAAHWENIHVSEVATTKSVLGTSTQSLLCAEGTRVRGGANGRAPPPPLLQKQKNNNNNNKSRVIIIPVGALGRTKGKNNNNNNNKKAKFHAKLNGKVSKGWRRRRAALPWLAEDTCSGARTIFANSASRCKCHPLRNFPIQSSPWPLPPPPPSLLPRRSPPPPLVILLRRLRTLPNLRYKVVTPRSNDVRFTQSVRPTHLGPSWRDRAPP